jgi:hypothetical protein
VVASFEGPGWGEGALLPPLGKYDELELNWYMAWLSMRMMMEKRIWNGAGQWESLHGLASL